MGIMLGEEAVTNVVKRLNGAAIEKKNGGFIRAYKYEKGKDEDSEYIAVNHLPFINSYEVTEGVVNVNVHIPKTTTNEPNTKRLGIVCNSVIRLFPNDTNINGADYSFYSDSRPTLDNDGTYYVNIKIKVRYTNIDLYLVETY